MKTRRGSTTDVGRRLSASAEADYKSAIRDCRITIGLIERALKDHEKKQAGDPKNYGYVGDVGHVKTQLLEVHRFLTS
jgi:hypothetical protein